MIGPGGRSLRRTRPPRNPRAMDARQSGRDGTMVVTIGLVACSTDKRMHPSLLRPPALEFRHGARAIYSFAVDGKLLHSFATVSRLGRDADGSIRGYQRPEILAHVAAIRAYLETDGAILPNS